MEEEVKQQPEQEEIIEKETENPQPENSEKTEKEEKYGKI